MRTLTRGRAAIGGVVAMLGLCGALGAAPAGAESAPSPPAAFAICAACHSTQPGETRYGPSLAHIAGRKAGSLPGYNYSAALGKSGLTWTFATLDEWLTSPQKKVPGTKMPFAGISDEARRRELVAYLMTLK